VKEKKVPGLQEYVKKALMQKSIYKNYGYKYLNLHLTCTICSSYFITTRYTLPLYGLLINETRILFKKGQPGALKLPHTQGPGREVVVLLGYVDRFIELYRLG
jgi:hypothetical protein